MDSHVIRVDIAGKGKSETQDNNVSQQHDQRKAVFIGNVKFSEKEDNIRKHFEKCGPITDVRLVRDTATGMGKGFGYVNFTSSDSVEKVSEFFREWEGTPGTLLVRGGGGCRFEHKHSL